MLSSDFIHWAVPRRSEPGKPDLYVLTDNEVIVRIVTVDRYQRSSVEEQISSVFCNFKKKSDILSPRGLLKFFKLKREDVVIKSCNFVWDNDALRQLHPRIADLVEKFSANFGGMLKKGLFQASQLLWIMESVPLNNKEVETWRERCWNQVVTQGVDTHELARFFDCNFNPHNHLNKNFIAEKKGDPNGVSWKSRIARRLLHKVSSELQDYINFFKGNEWRNPNKRPPPYSKWGLFVLEQSFDFDSDISVVSRSVRESFDTEVKQFSFRINFRHKK